MIMKKAKTFKTFGRLNAWSWNAGFVSGRRIDAYWKNFTESGSRGIKSSEWVSEKTKDHLKRMIWMARQWSENNQLLCAGKINPRLISQLQRVYGSQGVLPAECLRVRFLRVSGESHWAELAAVNVEPSQERSGLVPD
jgi:hypothetical protein